MERTNVWVLTNVVWYDGQDAFVSKFILQYDRISEVVTKESVDRVEHYLEGNGEMLKIDVLYAVDFDNIVAFKSYEDSKLESGKELYAAYDRFKTMYF